MFLKIASWITIAASVLGMAAYFIVYDPLTRQTLNILWVESPHATDLRNILDEFTDTTNIPVHVETVPRPLYREAIERELATTSPSFDMVIGDANWLTRDVSRGYYDDITTLVRGSWLFDHHDPAVDGAIYRTQSLSNDAVYSVPIAQGRFGIAYQAALFSNPANATAFEQRYGYPLGEPRTLAELTNLAEFFAQGGGGRPGLIFTAEAGKGALTETFLALLLAQGGMYADVDMRTVKGFVNSSVAVSVLEAMRHWYTLGRMGTTTTEAFTKSAPTFSAGKAAMLIAPSGVLRTATKGLSATSTMFAPLPAAAGHEYVYTKLYVASLVPGAHHSRAAKELIRWLGTKVAQEFLQQQSGTSLSADVRVATTSPYVHTRLFEDQATPLTFFVNANNEAMLRTADQYLFAYLQGTTTMSAQKTLDAVADAWETSLR